MAICCLHGLGQKLDFSGLAAVSLKIGNRDNSVRIEDVVEQVLSAKVASLLSLTLQVPPKNPFFPPRGSLELPGTWGSGAPEI